jgi:hypothetical protein
MEGLAVIRYAQFNLLLPFPFRRRLTLPLPISFASPVSTDLLHPGHPALASAKVKV